MENRACLAFYLFDLKELDEINFDSMVLIIARLDQSNGLNKKRQILEKIWAKLKLEIDQPISLQIYEKIIINFSKVLFTKI